MRAKVTTNFSILTDKLQSLVSDPGSRGRSNFHPLFGNSEALNSESEYEVIHCSATQQDALLIRDTLRHSFACVLPWIYVDPDGNDVLDRDDLVPLSQFTARAGCAATFYFKRSHLVPSFRYIAADMSAPRAGDELKLFGDHHSVVVFVITPEGRIMADRSKVGTWDYRDHFKWVLPMVKGDAPYTTPESLY
jgi:hypothetical protein